MDAFNSALAQLSAMIRSMTPRARVAAGVLGVVALASLAWVVRDQVVEEHIYLFGGQVIAADELATMQAALAKAKVNDFAVEGGRIRIARSQQAACLAALADAGALPATFNGIFEKAADKTTFFTSRQQQVENMKAAKRKGLTMVLRSMDDVESAKVEFDVDEPRGLRQERLGKALVAVKLRGGRYLDEDRVWHMQHIVAAAITGLTPRDVTVFDENARISYAHSAGSRGGSLDDPYRNAKRWYQADYEEKVRQLVGVPGLTVSAEVELNREIRREEKRVNMEPPDASLRQGVGTAAQSGANRPDTLALAPTEPLALPAELPVETGPPTQQQTTTELAGLTPLRVAISVSVPTSYFEAVWRQRNAVPAGKQPRTPPKSELDEIQSEEIARIEQQVATLIPASDPSIDRRKLVTVMPYPDWAPPESPPPSLAASAFEWVDRLWKPAAALSLAIVCFLMLRSLLRSSSAPHAATIPDPHFDAGPRRAPAAARPSASHDAQTPSAHSLREELAGMVRQDPDAAAHILRSWIGSAHS